MKLISYSKGVSKSVTPNARINAVGSLGSYGADTTGTQNMAKALDGMAVAIGEKIDADNKLALVNAQTDYQKRVNDLLYNDETGLAHTELAGAANSAEKFRQAEATIRAEVLGNLPRYQSVQDSFKQNADQLTNRADAQMESHEREQKDKYTDISVDNSMQESVNTAVLNYGSPDAVVTQLNIMKRNLNGVYGYKGKEYVAAMERKYVDALGAAALSKAMEENNLDATSNLVKTLRMQGVSEGVLGKAEASAKKVALSKAGNDQVNLDSIYTSVGGDPKKMQNALYEQNLKNIQTVSGGKNVQPRLMQLAQLANKKYGLPTNLVYAQLVQEASDGNRASGLSQLADENRNYAGLTQVAPNGEENRQRDGGTNYYRVFNSDEEFVDAYNNDFLSRYPELKNAKTAREWATVLKNNGYFTDDLETYASNMERTVTSMGPAEITDGQRQEAMQMAQQVTDAYVAKKKREEKEALAVQVDAIELSGIRMVKSGATSEELFNYYSNATNGNDKLELQFGPKMVALKSSIEKEKASALKADVTNINMLKQAVRGGASAEEIGSLMRDSGLTFTPEQQNSVWEFHKQRVNGKGEFAPQMEGIKSAVQSKMGLSSEEANRIWPGVAEAIQPEIESYRQVNGQEPTRNELIDIAEKAMTKQTLNLTETKWWQPTGDNYSVTMSPAEMRNAGVANIQLVKDDGGNPYVRITYSNGTTADVEPETARRMLKIGG